MRAILIGLISGLVASWVVLKVIPSEASAEALIVAYDQGKRDALRLNPVSMDLEMTCLNLWANKQPTPWEQR